MFSKPNIKSTQEWAVERIYKHFPEINVIINGISQYSLEWKSNLACDIIAVRKDLFTLLKNISGKTKKGETFTTDKYVFSLNEKNVWISKGLTIEIENNGVNYIIFRLVKPETLTEVSNYLLSNPDNEFARLANMANFLENSRLIA